MHEAFPHPPSLEERRENLRRDVATMRELGVLVWGDITLGPPPLLAVSEDAAKEDPMGRKRLKYEELLDQRFTDEELEKLP